MSRHAPSLALCLLMGCHVLMIADVPCEIGREDQCPPEHSCVVAADGASGTCVVTGAPDGGVIGDGDGDGDDGGVPDPVCPVFTEVLPPSLTVEPHVGTRTSNSPYDRGPTVYGAALDGRPTADLVAIDVGDPIRGALSEHADASQGSVVAWVQLGVDPRTVTGEVALFHIAPWSVSIRPGEILHLTNGTVEVDLPDLVGELADGEEHFFSIRWNAHQKLDLNNHVIVHVDAFYRGGIEAAWTPSSPTNAHLLGGTPGCANGITAKVAGLTLYRRVLTDGRSGTNLGDDNELATIRTSDDPLRVTGVFDVLLALPTDHLTTILDDNGQAWAMPLDDELANLDGFALSTILDDPGQRFDIHADVSVEEMPPEERIFDDGIAFRSVSPVHGLGMWIPVTPGDRIVARVLAHGEGGVEPQLYFLSPSFVIESPGPRGHASSSRDAPDELIATVEIPSGVADLFITVVDANATRDRVFVHQIEAWANLVVNPSAETGAVDVDCNCYVPTGWSAGAGLTGGGSQFAANAHSGASAVRIAGTFTDFPSFSIDIPATEMDDWDYYAVGAFFRWNSGDAPRVYASNGSLFPHTIRPGSRNNRKIDITPLGVANANLWTRAESVGRRVLNTQWNNHNDNVLVGGGWNAETDHLIDDVYVVRLQRVSLDLTPGATLVDEHIHVNGADQVTLALATNVTVGDVRFDLAWGNNLSGDTSCQEGFEALFSVSSDENDEIMLAGRNDGDLFLRLRDSTGNREFTTLQALPDRDATVSYRLSWDGAALQIALDDVVVFDVAFQPVGALTAMHPGSDGGNRKCDVRMTLPVVE